MDRPWRHDSIIVAAHVDDATIFLGGAIPLAGRIYYAASPLRTDQAQVLEAMDIPYTAVWGAMGVMPYLRTYGDKEARRSIYNEQTIHAALGPFISDEYWMYGARTIYTHNPWGEYGHTHHRAVSDAVCSLAQHYGMSVWCPAIRVDLPSRKTAVDLPLPTKTLRYDPADFAARKAEFTSREDIFPQARLWTWDDMSFTGLRRWLKLIDTGRDLRGPDVDTLRSAVRVHGF